MKPWFVYIVECADGSLYTGITTDLDRRVIEHNGAGPATGARYTRSRQPVRLVYQEQYANRSQATLREIEIKNLQRSKKLHLIDSSGNSRI